MLFRLALRITLNREDAEDIVQETLIRCWNNRDTWQEIDSIQAFTTTICRNLAIDYTKRKSRTERVEGKKQNADSETLTHEMAAQNSEDPLTAMLRQEQFAQVKAVIDSLPESQKSCIQLRDFEEKSYREISEMLQITEQQVKTNIFRARQTVKAKLKPNSK